MCMYFRALSETKPWASRLEEKGLDFTDKADQLRLSITPDEFRDNESLMTEFLQAAVQDYDIR
jgi:hypothetical protein